MSEAIDLLFLGSGNAFGAEGRAFSSFLLNGRYLFDCGPTVLQQLRKAGIASHDIEVVFISHFHADHFFGLPFILLDAKYGGRDKDIWIVGPAGVEAKTEALIGIGYPGLRADAPSAFKRHYVEVSDGVEAEVAGLSFSAARVDHVADLECLAFRVQVDERSLAYSGDSTLCPGLLRIAEGADVVVLELSCDANAVHLGPDDVDAVAKVAAAGAQIVVTHLDGLSHPRGFDGLHVARDLARFRF
ncbi:MAG TPA: MBL fold metallo-hydrolase [Dehalococcoidia bacterium]|nr:MBL fold metallo-hydrolase [Dehalococcoidia bacterium]